jgi:tetratricopeptide (TPR) repeat protein
MNLGSMYNRIIVLICLLPALILNTLSLSLPVKKIRLSINLTTQAQQNITAAHSAVSLWREILKDKDMIDGDIMILCNSLYASALCRSGNDPEAIQVYDRTISMFDRNTAASTVADVRLGRGSVLQRSMRYKEAKEDFIYVFRNIVDPDLKDKIEAAAFSAALCYARLGDSSSTETMLCHFLAEKDDKTVDPNLVAFLATLQLNSSDHALQSLRESVKREGISPVFKWILAVCTNENCNIIRDSSDIDELIKLASINVSPFDDYQLVHLDDKVHLHDLIKTCPSWPLGFILPRDIHQLKVRLSDMKSDHWVWKERSGYGSHGNSILTTEEVIQKAVRLDRSVLCQKLIDPSILCQGRKFSIRIYVVYFAPSTSSIDGNIYLLKTGLMKLASEEYSEHSTNLPSNENIFMTNSGRLESDGMTQYDLDYLQNYIDDTFGCGSFDRVWENIRNSVKEVMRAYNTRFTPLSSPIFVSNIPKILGLDYIIDVDLNPFLMEVNRFPGMEPRGESDVKVKQQVLLSAWKLASFKTGISCGLKHLELQNFEEI